MSTIALKCFVISRDIMSHLRNGDLNMKVESDDDGDHGHHNRLRICALKTTKSPASTIKIVTNGFLAVETSEDDTPIDDPPSISFPCEKGILLMSVIFKPNPSLSTRLKSSSFRYTRVHTLSARHIRFIHQMNVFLDVISGSHRSGLDKRHLQPIQLS